MSRQVGFKRQRISGGETKKFGETKTWQKRSRHPEIDRAGQWHSKCCCEWVSVVRD